MKRPILASLILSAVLPAAAFAGTCDAPTPLNQTAPGAISGTTCGGQIGIPLGGAVAPHPNQVYSFRYNNNATGALTVTGTDREVVITAGCTSPPITAFAPGVDANIGTAGLTNGTTYLMIVGSDSGQPVTDPPRCGEFNVTWQQLPVTLQGFSVE